MSETQKTIEIEVLRYHPEKDKEPHQQVFEVPFTDDMSVLQGVQSCRTDMSSVNGTSKTCW